MSTAAAGDIKVERVRGRARNGPTAPSASRWFDRFAGLDLDEAFELVALVLETTGQVGKHHPGTDFQAGGLVVPDIDGDLVLALQLCLEQADDAVVLELLSTGRTRIGLK
jgi:hypothetical protein